MSEEIKAISHKRGALKRALNSLETFLGKDDVDIGVLKERFIRLDEQYVAYDRAQETLAELDPENDGLGEMESISQRFFNVAAAVRARGASAAPQVSSDILNRTSIAVDNNTRRLKLPVVELPKFSGELDQWLSFKNTFLTMIDASKELTKLEKFIYLRDSLQGAALERISAHSVSEENYDGAWKILVSTYNQTRILVSKHLQAILDLPKLASPSYEGLMRLIDGVQQHVNMLSVLKVETDHRFLVQILQSALPDVTRKDWEKTLGVEELPKLDKIYEFIRQSAFQCIPLVSAASGGKYSDDNNNNGAKRRYADQQAHNSRPSKMQRGELGVHTFTTEASPLVVSASHCLCCKSGNHPLYRCDDFLQLSIRGRWDYIEETDLCKNCLRHHPGAECTSGTCRYCDQHHNSLLHDERKGTSRRDAGRENSRK